MPANAGQSAVDGQGSSLQNRFRADAGRTINTKKSIARPSSRQAQSPVNHDPSAGKSHHRLRHRHKQAGRITRSIWWNAGTREGPSGVAVNTGFFAAVSLLRGNQPPSLKVVVPWRQLTVFSTRGEPRPDTKRASSWASVGNATTSMRCPSSGKQQTLGHIAFCHQDPNINKLPKYRLPCQPHGSSKPTPWFGTLPSKCPALHRCWLFDPGRRKFRVTCDSNPSHPSPAPDDWMPSHVHPSLTTP